MGRKRASLGKTLELLLRYKPEIGGLTLDNNGWVGTGAIAEAVSRLHNTPTSADAIERLIDNNPGHGLEVCGGRARAIRTRRHLPHILYLAVSRKWADESRSRNVLTGGRAGALVLHRTEEAAWRSAHRRRRGQPAVLYIDAHRARQKGVRFTPHRDGTFRVGRLPRRFVLNLHEHFAFQRSAGGFLVRRGEDGRFEVGLVRVRRRRSSTWEVAKGKSEPGEAPWDTAVREVEEETGIDAPLQVRAELGIGHYGFLIPNGHPRLKVLHLYVIEVMGPIGRVQPAEAEGIRELAFFPPEEIPNRIVHDSLRAPAQRLLAWIQAQPDIAVETVQPVSSASA